ncbi:MAG: hypothetical protein JXO22_14310 [Phycisphaerae bacterium]|nr:hypothetical protein [Phycisphaerae bacterium]
MNFFTWLTTKRKTLATMSLTELRSQEMLVQNDRDRLQARMQKLAKEKQQIVERGAKEKTPEMRRTMAQQFDLLHTEQMMIGRHLNIRSKELLTVSRLRLLRESSRRTGVVSGQMVPIRERDLAVIEKLIEDEQISSELYQERLDEILQIGHAADEAASSGVSPAAEELLKVWGDMDAGLIKGGEEAFDETERRVRERDKAADA